MNEQSRTAFRIKHAGDKTEASKCSTGYAKIRHVGLVLFVLKGVVITISSTKHFLIFHTPYMPMPT